MLFTSPTICLRAATSSTVNGLRQSPILNIAFGNVLPRATKPSPCEKVCARIVLQARCLSMNARIRPVVFSRPSKTALPTLGSKYSTAAPTAVPLSSEHSLTWNRFLALRKTRRRISLFTSVITCAAATLGGVVYLSSSDFDRIAAQAVGLDPIVVLGLATFGFAGVGWLLGPFMGTAIFNVANKSIKPEMMKKEKDFFHRIKKHRVDPTNSSIQNPVPDFYGEKIGSVADYRTWLRDQRAFRLKRSQVD